MGIAIMDAAKLAKQNKQAYERLRSRQEQLQGRSETETAAQEKARHKCHNNALVPFRDTFSRLRNVDLAELESLDKLPSGALPDAAVQSVRLSATGAVTALVGGAATGAAVGATTLAAVGAFATASTGAAISGLSGAAATSATLAWLGGGAVATGGGGVAAGTTVMTGLVAAPVILALAGFVEWKGRQQRREQEETAAKLRKGDAELTLAEARMAAVVERSHQVRGILRKLRRELEDRLPAFELLVTDNDDYATYSGDQRRQVAEAVALATTLVTVLSVPFVDKKGLVTDLSASVVQDAKRRLAVLQAA